MTHKVSKNHLSYCFDYQIDYANYQNDFANYLNDKL